MPPTQTTHSESLRAALIESSRSAGAKLFRAHRHLIDCGSLQSEEVDSILETARICKRLVQKSKKPLDLLSDRIVATVFYENSTRTRSSFEVAATQLGARALNLDINTSSVTKGETIGDTAETLIAMGVDAIVQRHQNSGAALQLAQTVPSYVAVINAGDGWNAHPTQALLDLFTMLEVCDSVENKKIAIVGDVKHSRVARDNIRLLSAMGANVHVCGPPALMPHGIEEMGATAHVELAPAIENADFIMSLRMQLERQQQGLITSLDDYRKLYRLDHERMKRARGTVRVLHPGPINRGVELSGELADDPKLSLIRTQVTNGVPVRMAVLFLLLFAEENR